MTALYILLFMYLLGYVLGSVILGAYVIVTGGVPEALDKKKQVARIALLLLAWPAAIGWSIYYMAKKS